MTLSYQLHSDFTLYTPASGVHTPSILEAAEQLSSIYAPEGVSVIVNDHQIVVQSADTMGPNSMPSKGAAGASKPDAPKSPKR